MLKWLCLDSGKGTYILKFIVEFFKNEVIASTNLLINVDNMIVGLRFIINMYIKSVYM